MRFPLIDLLRAFAALTVVVFHVIAHFNWSSFPTSGPAVWFRIGGMGVDLFFVISGFVIALSAFSRLSQNEGLAFAIPFARARLARIVPLHYLTCLIFLVFVQPAIIFDHSIWGQMLTHALFIHNLVLMDFGGIDGVNWSIAVEMQFYVLMLLIAPWLRRADWRVVFAGGVAIAWAWRLGAFCLIRVDGRWGTFPLFVGISQLPGMLDEFTIGVLLARFVRSDLGQTYMAWLTDRPVLLPLLTSGVLWTTLTIYWRHASYWDVGPMVVCFKTMLGTAWALVVLTVCTVRAPRVVAGTAPLRYLGTISYGIYLWHLPVILALKQVTWLNGPTALPYVLVLTLILAAGSWHFFEQPIIKRVQQRSSTQVVPRGASK